MKDDNNHICKKVISRNDLAEGMSKMTLEELIKTLSDVQDELNAKGLTECAALIHRALNRICATMLSAAVSKRMEGKKKNEAA